MLVQNQANLMVSNCVPTFPPKSLAKNTQIAGVMLINSKKEKETKVKVKDRET